MVDRLTSRAGHQDAAFPPTTLHVLFAGGIHDAASGGHGGGHGRAAGEARRPRRRPDRAPPTCSPRRPSAQRRHRRTVPAGGGRAATRTVLLESGPGHATRCADTRVLRHFFAIRATDCSARGKTGGRDARRARDAQSLAGCASPRRESHAAIGRGHGRLERPTSPSARTISGRDGMYMIGQVAALRQNVCRIADLHAMSRAAAPRGCARWRRRPTPRSATPRPAPAPADVAIVGMAVSAAQGERHARLWENILDTGRRDHRDPAAPLGLAALLRRRSARPATRSTRSGAASSTTCRSIPMQLRHAAESLRALDRPVAAADARGRAPGAARRRLRSTGRSTASAPRSFSARAAASATSAAQYGVRAEPAAASPARSRPSAAPTGCRSGPRTPSPGILLNVAAGRVANRFDFGGVNFTVDAACASSLAAVYLAVTRARDAAAATWSSSAASTRSRVPFGYLCFSKTQALSPRGRCRTFDETRRRHRHQRRHRDARAQAPGRRRARRRPHLRRDQGRRRLERRPGQGPDRAASRRARCARSSAPTRRPAFARRPSACSRRTAPARSPATRRSCEHRHDAARRGRRGAASVRDRLGQVDDRPHQGHRRRRRPDQGGARAAPQGAAAARATSTSRTRSSDGADEPVLPARQAQPWIPTPGDAAARRRQRLRLRRHQLPRRARGVRRASAARPTRRTRRRWPAELLRLARAERSRARPQRRSGARADLARTRRSRRCATSRAQPRERAGARTARRVALVARTAPSRSASWTSRWRDSRAMRSRASGIRAHSHGSARQARGRLPRPGLAVHRHAARARARVSRVCAARSERTPCSAPRRTRLRQGRAAQPPHLPAAAYSRGRQGARAAALTATDVAQPALGVVEVALLQLMRALGVAPDMAAGHSYGEYRRAVSPPACSTSRR